MGSPSQQVGEGKPRSSDALVEPDTEVVQRYPGCQLHPQPANIVGALSAKAEGVVQIHCQALRLPVVVLLIAQLYEQVTRFLLENLLILVGEDVLPVSRNAFPDK